MRAPDTNEQNHYGCPVCKTLLQWQGVSYSVDELFALWTAEHRFSEQLIEEHRRQSNCTQLFSCPHCLLEIFLPQIIGTPNFYRELQEDARLSYYVDEKWDFEEALKDAKRCSSLIEIGCGKGAFLEKACRSVPTAFGTEYNETALEIARGKGLKVFRTSEDLTHMKGQFEAVFSFHVLEHAADPIAFMNDLISWIKPDGKVGISVPDQDGPIHYVTPCVQNMPPHHATRWKLPTLRMLAENLGLKILRVVHEPLIARDCYYYDHYWVNHVFPDGTLPNRVLKCVAPLLLNGIFKTLSLVNKQTFGLLKGQSIYLLLSKR